MADVKPTQLRPWVPEQPVSTSTQAWGPSGMPGLGRSDGSDVLLNRYRIMDTRGTGGFGTVLACWDTRLQRRVAIKRIPLAPAGAATDSASTLHEALAEARMASMLAHANIVTVYDFEVEGSLAYLVMEYVDGITLAELLARVEDGALTCDECAYLVASLGSALAFAHDQGLLHLDIKPTNIMIDTTGTVKLCDFGMATLASAAGYGGARGGTVGYMPPEQIEGGFVDERTDIYSLAVVCWQALAGSPPFAGARSAEQSLALEQKGAPSLSKLGVQISPQAEATLLGALNPVVTGRPTSAEAFATKLASELGATNIGEQSIRHLLSQADDPYEDELEDWQGERLPLAVMFPWLDGAASRLLTAGLALASLWAIAGTVSAEHLSMTRWSLVVSTVAAMAWTPLGSLLVTGATCARLVIGPHELAPLLLAASMALAIFVWWVAVGLHSRWSSVALLLPIVLGSPLATTPVALSTLRPAAALTTAGLGWLIGHAWKVLLATGFVPTGTITGLISPLLTTTAAISLVGCMVAAFVGSTMSHKRPNLGLAVFGQVLGACILIGAQFFSIRMENGGIWPQPTWDNAGIGVVLCVAMCIACACHGPQDEYPGGNVI